MSENSAILYNRPFIYTPPDVDIPIIHRDEDICIVDKPAGLLSVPGKAADHKDCLEQRLQAQYPQLRIVHRLDLATSGVMVLAANVAAHRHLGLQFERRHTAKTYRANVWGQASEEQGDIDLPLRCDWPNRPLQMVDHDLGRPAQTGWQVIGRDAQSTHMRLTPVTGRSHQLRVHMRELGHPILGDALYAPDEAFEASERLQLHAESLELFHPSGGQRLRFEAACPF